MKRLMASLFAGAVVFSTVSAAVAGTDDPVIQNREQRQEQRIQQGVASGQLTPGEAGRLEAQQAKIRQDEARMKANGGLTPRERRRLRREQNRASRHIYRAKHNGVRADVQ